jgi:drug/metabolite transporter (DMT)-like permease
MKRGVLAALGAAVLFGLSAPAAKLFVGPGGVAPLLLAGLLYLGSGVGLAFVDLGRRLRGRRAAPLPVGGRGRFAGAVLFGGVIAPALLMTGLRATPSSTASLLLNLEGVFTALIAWLVVREHTDRRIVFGFGLIVAGGVLLGFEPGGGLRVAPGALLVAAACLCWALDNNLTRAVSSADPVRLAAVKGLAAGATNTALALAAGGAGWPSWWTVGGVLVVGFFGYGLSLVLFIIGLRHLGTARNGAWFSAAPFVGAGASWLALGEPVGALALGAALLMAAGLALHARERHAHAHVHEEMVHTHVHDHDEHHQHEHPPGVDPRGPHSHEHAHARLEHAHPHAPDLHHRHAH